ncbi:MAG TPA: 2-phospho-L-lactate guanylyltransferase [Streptosporangiaceae bacterium]|jgi:2-phospho-L-lactate guanylyltransferase
MTADAPLTWSLVIPVKVLARAKSRLSGLAGPRRAELALAIAADTVAAAVSCPRVRTVIVVSDDETAAAALAGLGAVVVPDEPDDGLNPALRHGAAVAAALHPQAATGALAADLPALRPAELGLALRAAAAWPEAFVPDAAGSGTTLYTAAPGRAFLPRFGPSSRARHAAAGVTELALADVPGLRRDVDTPADLSGAARLGLGPRTAAIAPQLLAQK